MTLRPTGSAQSAPHSMILPMCQASAGSKPARIAIAAVGEGS